MLSIKIKLKEAIDGWRVDISHETLGLDSIKMFNPETKWEALMIMRNELDRLISLENNKVQS